jgi:hypothetical protein
MSMTLMDQACNVKWPCADGICRRDSQAAHPGLHDLARSGLGQIVAVFRGRHLQVPTSLWIDQQQLVALQAPEQRADRWHGTAPDRDKGVLQRRQ